MGSVVGTGWLVSEKAERDIKTQINAGGESRKEDDHGGHLFPTCLNGAGDSFFNVFAQNDKLNMGDMKSWELTEKALLENGCKIYSERMACCNKDSSRPESFLLYDSIFFSDGTSTIVGAEFRNCNPEFAYDTNDAFECSVAEYHKFDLQSIKDAKNYAKELSAYNNLDSYISENSINVTFDSPCNVSYENDMEDFGAESSSLEYTNDETSGDDYSDSDTMSV